MCFMTCLTKPAVITSGMDWKSQKPDTFTLPKDIAIVMVPSLWNWTMVSFCLWDKLYFMKTIFVLSSKMKLYPSGQGA